MSNSTEKILKDVRAFMGDMKNGGMRGVVANLQAKLEYLETELEIYKVKYREETGKERSELTDNERRRLARRGYALNSSLLKQIRGTWAPDTVLGWYRPPPHCR